MVSDSGTLILVKGISGSGKSTRVYLFLEFLEHIGVSFEPFKFVNIEGKEREIGVYAKDLDMVFVGKFYENGGIRRWQGYDSVTGRLHKAEGLSYFLTEMSNAGHTVVIDGAGTTASWRLRPLELGATNGILNILHIRYDYTDEQWDEYCKRIVYRSGKEPKGDAMWRKHGTFESDYKKAVEEAKEVNDLGACVEVYNRPYNTPVYDLGASILKFIGLPELVDDFVTYCKNSNYLQLNSHQTFTNGKGDN